MPETVQLPDAGREIPERRRRERRSGERRSADSRFVVGGSGVAPAFWAIIGSAVVLYLFVIAVAGVKPGDAPVATGIALFLAVLWLAHSWRRVIAGGVSPRGDRERRGF